MYTYGPPHMAGKKQGDQNEHIFSGYVRMWLRRPARGDERLGKVAREGYPCLWHDMMMMTGDLAVSSLIWRIWSDNVIHLTYFCGKKLKLCLYHLFFSNSTHKHHVYPFTVSITFGKWLCISHYFHCCMFYISIYREISLGFL